MSKFSSLFAPVKNPQKATLIVMIALVMSKLTGQIREMLIPGRIGFGELSDAFVLGFLIPDLVFQLLVGGSIQAAVTPTLSGAVYRDTQKKDWKSVSIFINITASLMLVAVLAGQFLIPYIMPLISGDRTESTVALAVSVSRILFPQVFFMMLAALAIGVLNAYKKFTQASLGPVFYNICVITAMLLFGNRTSDGVVRVAAGILMGAILYFLLQLFFAKEQFRFYRLTFDIKNDSFQRLLKLAVPTVISASVVQLNFIVLSAFTNLYDAGSLTGLRFAMTTWQLPYGVVTVAVGGVMLTTLSGYFAGKDYFACSYVLTKSLRNTLFIIVPSAIIFAILNREVIRAIFSWGDTAFTPEGISLTGNMLAWFCIAMVFHSIIYLMNMSFYSVGSTKIPLYGGLVSLVLNTAFCFIFTSFTDLQAVSMPVAYSITSIINAVLLVRFFKLKNPGCSPRKIPRYILKSSVCAVFTGAILLFIQSFGIDSDHKIVQLVHLAWKIAVAFGAYFAAALFIRIKEAYYILDKIKLYAGKLSGLVGFGRKSE